MRLSQLPPLGRYSVDALKLPTVRPWHDDGQVGGWTQEYAGLKYGEQAMKSHCKDQNLLLHSSNSSYQEPQ
ncbi:hypothetical protein EZV62_008995 [Acer yangbiense]|uniref:Uncharacterized protein n=1 Tax=Acer yangbiense TaxID=1000413 RepID=A0A5C7IEH7_9ROSI|nr:hypothetical protein EZV62_008995 [Acer yangbiense]